MVKVFTGRAEHFCMSATTVDDAAGKKGPEWNVGDQYRSRRDRPGCAATLHTGNAIDFGNAERH
jgi:hypothetical protein